MEPAVAFLDLTGFTSLTQERGDTIAAEMALRLADLASRGRHARIGDASSSCWATGS